LKQAIINYLYRYPLSAINRYSRFGGYLNYRRILHGSAQMKKAAAKLPPLPSSPGGVAIYFLTGKKYLYQTLFCIQSLLKVSKVKYNFVLVDDGSFDEAFIKYMNNAVPGAEIITQVAIKENLNNHLPAHLFPVLHHKRGVYPHIKKLTDIHTLPGSNWKLVIDSDMLFWAEPAAILDWLKEPTKPLYMLDCKNSYGYSKNLMEELSGLKIPDLLNVGVIGLDSSKIDWHKLEKWTAILEEKEGSSYFLEQALTAMLIGETEAAVLPADEYMVNPQMKAIEEKTGVLHHYVDLSKEGYFKKAWRMI
jgi:hypothetical protein